MYMLRDDVRNDFPILDQTINGRPLIYLDNAATTQVPCCVVDAIANHYRNDNANVHRATHTLSSRSTESLENARKTVARFLNARSSDEIVFTRGTTDSINLVASSLALSRGAAFSAVSTMLEHHSNFVPWQQAARQTGGTFSAAPLTERGDLDLAALEALLSRQRPGIVAVAHVSNVLGTVNPVKKIVAMAHGFGWFVLVDAAQSVRHELVDVAELDCDFLCFSGHKVMGPTGIGVLYGKKDLLNSLPPVNFGGEMVDLVSTGVTSFETTPLRFEAGTPNYVGAIGLARALEYLSGLGREAVHSYEHDLVVELENQLNALDAVNIVGSPAKRAGVVTVTAQGAHPYDVATLMDKMGVAVRSGTQCAQPLLREVLDMQTVLRFSPAFYNTKDEIRKAVCCLKRAIEMCRGC